MEPLILFVGFATIAIVVFGLRVVYTLLDDKFGWLVSELTGLRHDVWNVRSELTGIPVGVAFSDVCKPKSIRAMLSEVNSMPAANVDVKAKVLDTLKSMVAKADAESHWPPVKGSKWRMIDGKNASSESNRTYFSADDLKQELTATGELGPHPGTAYLKGASGNVQYVHPNDLVFTGS